MKGRAAILCEQGIWRTSLLQRSGVRLYFFYRCDDICNVAFFSQEQFCVSQIDSSADASTPDMTHCSQDDPVIGAIKHNGKARGKSWLAIERPVASATGNTLSVERLDKVIA